MEAAAVQEVGGAGLHQTRTVEMQERGGGLRFILKIKPNRSASDVRSEGKEDSRRTQRPFRG